jgi:hypothetical protein
LGHWIATGNGDPSTRVLVENGIRIDGRKNFTGCRVSPHKAAGIIRTNLSAISVAFAFFPIGLRFALDDLDRALGAFIHTLTASRAFFGIKEKHRLKPLGLGVLAPPAP